ncbi:MAG: hypothetical protein RLZZ367_154 [Bacteroidota bacterium]|jgi:hypothetical protein
MKRFCLLLLLAASAGFSNAQTVTYAQHIAPIIYSHCTQCHRPGEIGPFSLTNYNEVKAQAGLIKYTTSIKYMPPWKADPNYQQYQKVNILSDAQIQLISDWVTQGMLRGDSTTEPELPVFPTGSLIGTPDLTISFAQSHTIAGNNTDEYRYFVIPTGLTQNRDLVALEMRPGNTSVVHHALFWEDTTGNAAAADAATPEYGYTGSTQQVLLSGMIDKQLPTYVPGQKATVLNNGIAYRMHAGSDLQVQIHYAPSPVATTDSSSFNLFFAPQPATRYIKSHVMIPFFGTLTNGPFVIPANQVKEFHGTYTLPEEASLISTMPHMHKLGTHWKIYAVKPNGDTVPLVKIDSWDFNWQSNFDFKHMIHLPQGTVIHAYAGYDNTPNNINNPNDPPQQIGWGENTSDEMYWLPLQWVSYQAGDENIDMEVTGVKDDLFYPVQNKLYPVYPNPSANTVKAGFSLRELGRINLKLYNMNGQVVSTIANNQLYMSGVHTVDIDLSVLPAGIYSLQLEKDGERQSQQIVVAR